MNALDKRLFSLNTVLYISCQLLTQIVLFCFVCFFRFDLFCFVGVVTMVTVVIFGLFVCFLLSHR